MWTSIRRVLGLDRRRAFDAAGGGRRWEQARTVDSLNAAILAGATVAARRAGYYARNNPWIAAAVQSLVANAAGTDIKPRSTHPDAKVRDALHALWAQRTGVKLRFIDPGKPIQNAFAESIIGKFRDECLNENWFGGLPEARRIIETWRIHYNTRRPHSSLGYLTPAQYAARGGALRSPEGFAPRPLAEMPQPMIQTEGLTP